MRSFPPKGCPEMMPLGLWLCSPTTYFKNESRPVGHFDTEPAQVLDVVQHAWNVAWSM